MTERDEPKADDLLARTGGAVAGGALSLIGVVLFGPAGALLGSVASPAATDGIRGLQRVFRRRIEKAEQAVAVAEESSGRSIGELVALAEDDDRKVEIIGRALQAAALAGDEQMIRALGRSLVSGVLAEDTAKVDEYLRVVTSLSTLEPIDVRVLNRMSQADHTWLKRPAEGRNIPGYTQVDPSVEPVVDAIFSRLTTQGLITSEDPKWFGPSWRLTDFGQLCLATLRDIGSQEQSGDVK